VTAQKPEAHDKEDLAGSFAKGLSVIRAFDSEHASMSLSDVARRTGLSRATARRFLLTLVALGYAELNEKRFALRPRVLELGFAYLRSLGLPEILTPHLRRVSETLNESSSAAVLDGLDVVYVARVQTRRIMSVDLGVGARLPAPHGALGRVLLAALSPSACAAAMRDAVLPPHTRRSVTSKQELRRILEDVAQSGFCIVDQEFEEGLRSIAVPVADRRGRVLAAMNVSCQANRVALDVMKRTFLPVLREAADAVRDDLP
jgi:IclR family pca regulon transcriptional regulator